MISIAKTGITEYATPGDRDVVVTRVVDAPRRIVWDAWTNPRHVPKWLVGPPGWSMPECEIDLRPGGKWRFVYRKADGAEMTLTGSYREVAPPERVVSTETWGPEWPETVNTVVFTEVAGQTTITLTITYPSSEAREAALKTGMKDGMDPSFARLDQLVQELS